MALLALLVNTIPLSDVKRLGLILCIKVGCTIEFKIPTVLEDYRGIILSVLHYVVIDSVLCTLSQSLLLTV